MIARAYLKAKKNRYLITVKDTGLGTPSDQLEKVFDRFYQVDSSQTRGYEGSGLGMALAKELVELHKKGKISIQSTEGKSTTFTVLLPLGKEHLNKEEITDGIYHTERDYLSKPFDADELKLIVRNRIEERRKMRERFSRAVTLEPKQISITSLDEKFLERVLEIIEAHMDDENFSIEKLSREAGFSNMHFYRKIKALSGETPSEFLRTIRLKRAAELLAKNSDNVTQVAYAVGFSSLSYFNKCFKEQFGVTPGQYADANPKSEA